MDNTDKCILLVKDHEYFYKKALDLIVCGVIKNLIIDQNLPQRLNNSNMLCSGKSVKNEMNRIK